MKEELYRIFSFYNSKVSPRVPEYQRAVFRKFGNRIEHVVREDFGHGDFLNYVCQNIKDTKYIIVFDVDCIPVSPDWVNKLLKDLEEPDSLVGAAQTANHLQDGKNLYISPFFFAISTEYLKKLNYPDMRMTDTMDAGQNLTGVVTEAGGKVKYWWPTDIEKKEWALYHPEHKDFGPGTTYNNLIYHAFYSRFDQSDRFVKKCKSLLSFTDRLMYLKVPRTLKKISALFR